MLQLHVPQKGSGACAPAPAPSGEGWLAGWLAGLPGVLPAERAAHEHMAAATSPGGNQLDHVKDDDAYGASNPACRTSSSSSGTAQLCQESGAEAEKAGSRPCRQAQSLCTPNHATTRGSASTPAPTTALHHRAAAGGHHGIRTPDPPWRHAVQHGAPHGRAAASASAAERMQFMQCR